MTKVLQIFCVVLLVGVVLICVKNVFAPNTPEMSNIKDSLQGHVEISIGQKLIDAEVANTEATREQGLGGREELLPDKGMFFVFSKPDYYAFWMKDMSFPIDIIWLNEGLKIIKIEEKVPPESYPQAYTPEQKSLYVLEVKSGFISEQKIKIGDQIKIVGATQN